MNNSACGFYHCGHVQKVEVCQEDISNTLFIRANCLPEMRKDWVYNILMKLNNRSFEIRSTHCGCPAGRGPGASCKHIAAFCYALEEFARLKQLPDLLSCTDKLQTWNQPRSRKLQPIPVENLRSRKHEIMPPKKRSSQQPRVVSQFDPHPESLRAPNPEAPDAVCFQWISWVPSFMYWFQMQRK